MPGVKVKVKGSTAEPGDPAFAFGFRLATPPAEFPAGLSPSYRRSPASSSPSTNRTVK